MKTNKGYTLVEMMIVIAIMAILTGLAVVTIGIIKDARCTAAVDTFQNQVSSLWIKTKAVSQSKTQSSPMNSADPQSTYPLCMYIERNTDSSDSIKDNSYQVFIGYTDGSNFIEKESVATMTELITIQYTGEAVQMHPMTVIQDGVVESVLIQFSKSDGSVDYGAGTYKFISGADGDENEVATVYLDAITGNHDTK